MYSTKPKAKRWPIVLLVIILLLAGSIFYSYRWLKNLSPEQILRSDFIQDQIRNQFGDEKAELFALLPEMLGFSEPKTYLLLFLNNTELRPGGGFVGVYATVRVDKGETEILALEGTEVIDSKTPASWNPKPPQILTEQLKVNKWYFRDSNWSPDFEVNAKKALEFYKGEGGVVADNIDAVVGITATTLEKLLEITGPVTVEGITFSPEDVIEKLEYEVEYGYDERGIHFVERKQIIKPFMLALLGHVKDNLFQNISEYGNLFGELASEKHVMLYSLDESLQEKIESLGFSGEVVNTQSDYLMWVDANLASLKTDYAIDRSLQYSLSLRPPAHESEDYYYMAAVTMKYKHRGAFNWRTSRYRTYARVYVPQGSKLTSAIVTNGANSKVLNPEQVGQGIELGKQWFGLFVSFEPGTEGSVQFIYKLPDFITRQIDDNLYTLFVQKQLGTVKSDLTLKLDFDKTIISAKPGEERQEWGDKVYRSESDLRVDREFSILF